MSCTASLDLSKAGLFRASFLYRDGALPIDVTGSLSGSEFTLFDGAATLYTATNGSGITTFPSQGRWDLLIPQTVIATLDFTKVKFRFRINWITDGWEVLAEGGVTLHD